MLAEEVLGLLKEFHDDKTEFSVKYRVQHAISDRESYLAKFESERTKEFQKGISLFGPQVDEIDFYYNGKLLRNFGSTGQCRLISLCLKMAEVNILARSGDNEDSGKLIILVDDVTGELDLNTKKSFFKVINKADQAFFTFTENPQDEYFENADIFSINDGKLNSKI
jgi:DNA replication and repair protein RecF